MDKFEFTADPNTYEQKPTAEEAAKINNSLRPADVNSIEDFLEGIEKGISWSPSVFDGRRSNQNWVGSCIAALDFDGGITPTEAIQRIQAYEIVPSAWYPTYGDSPEKRKFRLLFFLDTLITNRKARNHLMDLLLRFYPEADRACRDEAHFFYGTNKKGEVLNPKAISLDLLMTVLNADAVKAGRRLRRLKIRSEGSQKLRALGRNFRLYSDNIGPENNAMSDEEKKKAIKKLKDNLYSKEVDWDKLQDRVRIFYDFMNSDQRLKYESLLGLAQNLA